MLFGGMLLGVLAMPGASCGQSSADHSNAAPAPAAPPPAAQPPVPAPQAPESEPAPRLGRGRVIVPGGREFAVEVVQDPESRTRGLQNRPALPQDQGMVFVFPAAGRHRFWMYKCLIPLDIIWLDASRTVVHLEENLPFCKAEPCPDYGPDKNALYVLELGAGVARGAGIRPGMRLTILFDQPPDPR